MRGCHAYRLTLGLWLSSRGIYCLVVRESSAARRSPRLGDTPVYLDKKDGGENAHGSFHSTAEEALTRPRVTYHVQRPNPCAMVES